MSFFQRFDVNFCQTIAYFCPLITFFLYLLMRMINDYNSELTFLMIYKIFNPYMIKCLTTIFFVVKCHPLLKWAYNHLNMLFKPRGLHHFETLEIWKLGAMESFCRCRNPRCIAICLALINLVNTTILVIQFFSISRATRPAQRSLISPIFEIIITLSDWMAIICIAVKLYTQGYPTSSFQRKMWALIMSIMTGIEIMVIDY